MFVIGPSQGYILVVGFGLSAIYALFTLTSYIKWRSFFFTFLNYTTYYTRIFRI